VLAPFIGFLWSLTRIFVQAPAGRQRFNVLGAINAITQELVTVTNNAYITAESVCALLDKLHNLKFGIPITLFLDNARYQHYALVIAKAQCLHIELCFLPSYSPNLNLMVVELVETSNDCGSSSKRNVCIPDTTRILLPSKLPSTIALSRLPLLTKQS
jgi:hypothetical protein